MLLNLTRPLCYFDIESTGTNTQTDRIITLFATKYFTDNTKIDFEIKVNPGCPIPAGSTKIHGITDADVQNAPLFVDIAPEVLAFFTGCDLATFNGNKFDIPLLLEEFTRCGLKWDLTGICFVDVAILDRKLRPRKLKDIYKHYTLKELENAHNAEADINATYEVLECMLCPVYELPREVADLALLCSDGKPRLDVAGKFCYNDAGEICFNFGQHKDKPAAAEFSYLQWMLSAKDKNGAASFSEDTKHICYMLLGQ